MRYRLLFSCRFNAQVESSIDILFMKLAALWRLKLCGRSNVLFAVQIAHWLQLIITFRAYSTTTSEFLMTLVFDLRTAPRTGDVATDTYVQDPTSRAQLLALEKNIRRSRIPYYGLRDERQGNMSF